MKITAKKYFFCSNIKAHVNEGETVEVTKKYGQDAIQSGLAEDAGNKKVGLRPTKEGVKILKEAKAKADKIAKEAKEAAIKKSLAKAKAGEELAKSQVKAIQGGIQKGDK